MQHLHEKVRAIRLRKGITQEQAGSHLNTTKSNYNRMEKGHVEVSPSKLIKLAELFEMTPEAIASFQTEEAQSAARSELEQLRERVARLEGYVAQTDQLLTESATFFRYFERLLNEVFYQGKDQPASLEDLNREWARLVSYSGENTEAAQRERAQHQMESPLMAAKLSQLEMVVQAMQSVFRFYEAGKAQTTFRL
ncbi:helix-turn-helix transcriptional regulator [Hymenobacter sp. BT635]|uniref:Helix-turn-helix transcriptional regulator n=1 Tax=Hymenobacter nitidus TaxID=2880929 RepID=A0ABS8ALM0_9BACT|nr:helix-turn-helix transcriptional regulator [Hymenobacter nitidus]MCB2380404.1 helix-turn-helix transcriptional regulator [Hymenobacter nitidus]